MKEDEDVLYATCQNPGSREIHIYKAIKSLKKGDYDVSPRPVCGASINIDESEFVMLGEQELGIELTDNQSEQVIYWFEEDLMVMDCAGSSNRRSICGNCIKTFYSNK